MSRKLKKQPKFKSQAKSDVKKGNQLAAKKHLYAGAFMDQEEADLFETLSLDSLDDEIRVVRLRLRRAYQAERDQRKRLEETKKGKKVELDTILHKKITGTSGGFRINTEERIVKDYGGDIDRISAQLKSMIALRNQVLEGKFQESDGENRAKAMEEASKRMDSMFTVVKEK